MLSRRGPEAGFTLLESLLAAAILALIAVPTMSAFSRAAQQDGPRIEQLEKFEFAVSLLEERVATKDFSAASGTYENRFSYVVRAEPYPPIESTRFDDLIAFTQLTVVVSSRRNDERPVEISQIVAHAVDK